MTLRFIRACATIATLAALLSVPAGIAIAQTPLSAEAGWQAVRRCAGEATERARHNCLDDLLKQAGLLTAERQAQERREGFGLANETAPAAAATRATALPEMPPAPPAAERVEVSIAAVTVTHDARLVVTTTEGAVWRQIESLEVRPPVAGQPMTIRKASLGSFLCTLSSGKTFRCKRSR